MKKYNNYAAAEADLIERVTKFPDFITKSTYERFQEGFILTNPRLNRNKHSRYDYAEEFFQWMISGEKDLSAQLLNLNPWAQRFVDSANLPESFSASYGWKIKEQLRAVTLELFTHRETRRAYINILIPDDKLILGVKTTHEFPCTIGLQFFIRNDELHLHVNMRSNNVYSVMPYDVYNFTRLQEYVGNELKIELGCYYHQINSAHLYKGDVRRLTETSPIKQTIK